MGGGFGSKFGVGPEGILAAGSRASAPAGRCGWCSAAARRTSTAGYRDAGAVRAARSAPARDGALHGDRGVGRHGHGQRRLDVPVARAGEVASTRATTSALMVAAGRARTSGRRAAFRAPGVMEGTFGVRAGARRAGRGASASTRSSCAAATTPTATRAPAARTARSACSSATTGRPSWPAGPTATRSAADGRIRRGMGAASQIWWGGGGPPAYAEVRIGKDARPVSTRRHAGSRHRHRSPPAR